MTTADVVHEVAMLERLREPFLLHNAVRDADLRVQAFYSALNCTAGDFVEYNLSRVHADDLPALLGSAAVKASKVKTAATAREIRRRAKAGRRAS